MHTDYLLELKQHLRQLKTPAVRDLAWCCMSPGLLESFAGANVFTLDGSHSRRRQWLKQLDKQPEPLLSLIATHPSNRLGLYYETLWRFYFSHYPGWQLLGHNIQITRAGATLGAFDFLCSFNNQFFHIETAVKFYLRTEHRPADTDSLSMTPATALWIGPNQKDRLNLKLDRLCQHQLPLSQTQEGQAYLKQAFPQAKKWHRRLCLQGYLFYEAGAVNRAKRHTNAPALDPHHLQGLWLRAKDALALLTDEKLAASGGGGWLILERLDWLSPAQTEQAAMRLNSSQLGAQIQRRSVEMKKPLLIAALQEVDGVWQESQRVFVVPNDWPQTP
jgi:uncharacterized protein